MAPESPVKDTYEPVHVAIEAAGGGYTLLRNGVPSFVLGAAGHMHLERLRDAGGNSIRAGVEDLETAHRLGLTVLAGLPFGKPRAGFDYLDRERVAEQRERLRTIVRSHRRHPALLMWALGNELEIFTTPEQRVPLWRAVDEAATMIHEEDPDHPVITPIGDLYKSCLHELNAHCPNLDAVGLNSYADMLSLPEDLQREGWTRPYIITEFGPRGHWQVPRAPWGVPIEDTSTEKADFYLRAYTHAVEGRLACLGAYVFHWAQHHEKTHTWYGMFLEDGSPTAAVEVMEYLWTGRWPARRWPVIGPGRIGIGSEAPSPPTRCAAGAELDVSVDASHPQGEPLHIEWDLRPDVSDHPNVGGDPEPSVRPIPGSILRQEGPTAKVRIPAQPGKYRLFVAVRDPGGRAAVANLPILAEQP
jgi:hypothetical protein